MENDTVTPRQVETRFIFLFLILLACESLSSIPEALYGLIVTVMILPQSLIGTPSRAVRHIF